MSASRKGVNPHGAVTEYGDATVLEWGDSFAGGIKIRFPDHLQADFGEELVMLLDQVTYFTAEKQIKLLYFPAESRHLNPTEEYWTRPKQAPGDCYFGALR